MTNYLIIDDKKIEIKTIDHKLEKSTCSSLYIVIGSNLNLVINNCTIDNLIIVPIGNNLNHSPKLNIKSDKLNSSIKTLNISSLSNSSNSDNIKKIIEIDKKQKIFSLINKHFSNFNLETEIEVNIEKITIDTIDKKVFSLRNLSFDNNNITNINYEYQDTRPENEINKCLAGLLINIFSLGYLGWLGEINYCLLIIIIGAFLFFIFSFSMYVFTIKQVYIYNKKSLFFLILVMGLVLNVATHDKELAFTLFFWVNLLAIWVMADMLKHMKTLSNHIFNNNRITNFVYENFDKDKLRLYSILPYFDKKTLQNCVHINTDIKKAINNNTMINEKIKNLKSSFTYFTINFMNLHKKNPRYIIISFIIFTMIGLLFFNKNNISIADTTIQTFAYEKRKQDLSQQKFQYCVNIEKENCLSYENIKNNYDSKIFIPKGMIPEFNSFKYTINLLFPFSLNETQTYRPNNIVTENFVILYKFISLLYLYLFISFILPQFKFNKKLS